MLFRSIVVFDAFCDVDSIFFTVQDSGIGIPPNDIKTLFEPFHRAENVGSVSGTGLGLAIVKNAVEIHGGSISVESQQNSGTTFKIKLPLVTDNNF